MNIADITNGLTGAWRITMRDAQAKDCFDLSAAGAMRSFGALPLALPVIFFTSTLSWRFAREAFDIGEDVSYGLFITTELASTIIYWALFLAAMARVSRMLKLEAYFTPYLITYNWGTLFTTIAFAQPLIPHALGIYSATTGFMLAMPVMGLLAWYRWQITRDVLGAQAGPAFAIIVFEVVLSLSVDQILGMLLMPGVGVST
ncbi:MAG: hypothetical protein ABJ325_01260 [Nitratireductor sp.]